MNVYFISGLAADRRVFQHIRLPAGFNIQHVDWIDFSRDDTLETYSTRLGEAIDVSKPYGLLGLSMGGMIACEMNRQAQQKSGLKPSFVILISSVATSAHLPFYFRWSSLLGLHNLIPVRVLKSASFLNRYFSADHKEDRRVIRQVIRESDPRFIKWAMGAVAGWRNVVQPDRLIHIHGSSDRILPLKYTRPTHVLKGANHLMVMSRARQINEILASEITPQL